VTAFGRATLGAGAEESAAELWSATDARNRYAAFARDNPGDPRATEAEFYAATLLTTFNADADLQRVAARQPCGGSCKHLRGSSAGTS